MERRVADGHPDLARIGRDHPLHERIEAAAGFAGGIEEFHDVDLRVGRSGGRGMIAGEVRQARQRLRGVGLLALIDERADDERHHEGDGGGDEKRLALHLATL